MRPRSTGVDQLAAGDDPPGHAGDVRLIAEAAETVIERGKRVVEVWHPTMMPGLTIDCPPVGPGRCDRCDAARPLC